MPVPSQPGESAPLMKTRASRRGLFAGAGAAGLATLVGCSGSGDQPSTSPSSARPSYPLASASQGSITISEGWVAATEPMDASGTPSTSPSGSTTPMAPVSAAYGVVSNSTDKHDALLNVTSPVAGKCLLHITADGDAAASMKQVNLVDIPPNGSAVFAIGGFHVMLTELTQELKEGDKVDLTWTFRSNTKITTTFPVIARANRPGS